MNKENLSNSKKEGKLIEVMYFMGENERRAKELGYDFVMDFEDENGNCINEEVYRP